MKIGMMNDPRRNPLEELRWAARKGFAALDLTLESPAAEPHRFPAARFGRLAAELGLEVVGHTAWYLPLGSPVPRLRQAAVEELCAQLPVYREAGARLINVHPYLGPSNLVPRHESMSRCADSLHLLADQAERLEVRVMVENLPDLSEPEDMDRLLADPRLGFHLDIAHAAIGKNRCRRLLERFWPRLVHVHLSDNSTLRDDHLPLGAGRVSWKPVVAELKRRGYQGVITLEVFSDERDLLLHSRDQLRRAWEA